MGNKQIKKLIKEIRSKNDIIEKENTIVENKNAERLKKEHMEKVIGYGVSVIGLFAIGIMLGYVWGQHDLLVMINQQHIMTALNITSI